MAQDKYDTLVVDPEMEDRIKIKQATNAVTTFGKFSQCSDIDEGLKKLAGPESVDVVFVANRFEMTRIASFIKAAKQTPCGQNAAYIMIVKTQEELAKVFAQNVLIGMDGFLAEPYSVEALDEITKIAARVRKERSEAREEAAIKFLMNQISDQISVIAQLKSYGLNPLREIKKLNEMCDIFKTLDQAGKERYLRIAVAVFESAPLPKPAVKGKMYGGASSRVKKRMEAKIIEKLGADVSADTDAPAAATTPAAPAK